MIVEHETNVVYVADTLEPMFPSVFGGLKTILEQHGIPLRTIPGTHEIWCRDYMPIQVPEVRFVQFRYAPDYLTGKYRCLRADGEIGPTLPFIRNCVRSEIVLDGGNVVRWRDAVILTDKIYSENPGMAQRELEEELRRTLEVERLIVIPMEPGDVVGHADGVVRFVDRNRVIINDYRRIDRAYRWKLLKPLKAAGLKALEIPYRPDLDDRNDIPSAVGNYVNFLQIENLIVMPAYGLRDDRVAQKAIVEAFPKNTVRTLRCRALAEEGGVLNCATWNTVRTSFSSLPVLTK